MTIQQNRFRVRANAVLNYKDFRAQAKVCDALQQTTDVCFESRRSNTEITAGSNHKLENLKFKTVPFWPTRPQTSLLSFKTEAVRIGIFICIANAFRSKMFYKRQNDVGLITQRSIRKLPLDVEKSGRPKLGSLIAVYGTRRDEPHFEHGCLVGTFGR